MGITAVFGFYDCQRWDFSTLSDSVPEEHAGIFRRMVSLCYSKIQSGSFFLTHGKNGPANPIELSRTVFEILL